MNHPEREVLLRRGVHSFDKYGIAMSALVAPNDFCLFDEARDRSQRLKTIKGIAITGLREVVNLARQTHLKPLPLAMEVAERYYADDLAERLADPVKLFQPNPLLVPSMIERISKGRKLLLQTLRMSLGISGIAGSLLYKATGLVGP